jgi:hypothetical protein
MYIYIYFIYIYIYINIYIQGIKNHLMTTQNSLSKTKIPFSEIVRMNKFWINAATSKYTQIEYEAEIGR